MRYKKENIIRAIDVIVVALFFYTSLHFISTENLFELGTNIEAALHIHTEINVETMRSYLTTLLSGIVGSAFVAFCFFIIDYRNEKIRVIQAIIDENRKLSDHYKKIPWFDISEYGELCRTCYIEFLCMIEKIEAESSPLQILSPYSHRPFQYDMPNTARLKKYLLEHKDYLKLNFSGEMISVDKKVADIISQMHLDITLVLKILGEILESDLTDLKKEVYSSDFFFRYSYRQLRTMKNILKHENHMLPDLLKARKLPRGTVEQRILHLHSRMHQKINEFFGNYDLTEGGIERIISNHAIVHEILCMILFLQKDIFEFRSCYFGQIACNKFIFTLEKLDSILLYIITGYVSDTTPHAALKGRQIQKGRVMSTRTISGESFKDIYEK